MRNVLKALIMAGCLFWLPIVAAEEQPADPASEMVGESGEGDEANGKGMSVFWLVFLFSVLFVLSSATALHKMGGKTPPPRQKKRSVTASPKDKKLPEGKERFRL